jgi:hypothetical protein
MSAASTPEEASSDTAPASSGEPPASVAGEPPLELEQATMPRRKSVEKKLRCETVHEVSSESAALV